VYERNIVQELGKKVDVKVLGGNLKVYAEQTENGFKNVWLEGPAKQVFKGKINL
jgi:diaminopimelate epimerase